MTCPQCGNERSRVIDTRHYERVPDYVTTPIGLFRKQRALYRRRRCTECLHHWWTGEVPCTLLHTRKKKD